MCPAQLQLNDAVTTAMSDARVRAALAAGGPQELLPDAVLYPRQMRWSRGVDRFRLFSYFTGLQLGMQAFGLWTTWTDALSPPSLETTPRPRCDLRTQTNRLL